MKRNKKFIKYFCIVLIGSVCLYIFFLRRSMISCRKYVNDLHAQSDELRDMYMDARFDLLLKQERFKLFNETLGKTFIEDKEIRLIGRSSEMHNNKITYLAISATRPIEGSKYLIKISLRKNFPSKQISMEAKAGVPCSVFGDLFRGRPLHIGRPAVFMEIPMTEFEKILKNWLSSENIENLLEAYQTLKRQIDEEGEDFDRTKLPVYVEYVF